MSLVFHKGNCTEGDAEVLALKSPGLADLALSYNRHPRYSPKERRANERLQAVAFVNFKGGSGKTTSATAFCTVVGAPGISSFTGGLGSQASATALLGVAPATDVRAGNMFAAWIRREDTDEKALANQLIWPTYWPALDLLPANIALQHAEYDLVGNLLRKRDWPFYAQLENLLAHVAPKYDVAVIDCRPDVGMLTINALVAATGLVVPIPPSMIDFASSGEFFRFMAEIAGVISDAIYPRGSCHTISCGC